MFSAKSTIIIQAPKKEVWAKLSKLDDIANWSSGIGTSVYSSEITSGVGTQRSCDIPGIGTLVEDIVEWRDEHKFCYEISGISIMKWGRNCWEINKVEHNTELTFSAKGQVRYGLIGWFIERLMLKRQMIKTQQKMLEEFKVYVETGKPL